MSVNYSHNITRVKGVLTRGSYEYKISHWTLYFW